MLKISSALALVCVLSATSAMSTGVITTNTARSSLQQVKFVTQKNVVNQGQVESINTTLNTTLQEKAITQNDSTEPASTTAQVGLLAMALLCFVLRSSRRKV